VKPDRGQEQRHPAEKREQRDRESLSVAPLVHLLLQTNRGVWRQGRIERVGFARQRIRDRARSFLCADKQSVPDKKVLANRHIKERPRSFEFCLVVHIFRDTDDLHPIVFHFEPLTERILSRPIFRRHRFIDDRNSQRILVVISSKLTAGDQRDPESGEIILADLNIIRVRLLIRRGLVTIDLYRRGRWRVVTERHYPRQSRGLNTGERSDAIEQLRVKNFSAIEFVARRK